MSLVAETWMPVSGTFKVYPLAVELLYWEGGPVIFSRGHHDPAVFLVAAVLEWAENEDSTLVDYDGVGWTDIEGPIWPPRRLRSAEYVRHEWWATRMHPDAIANGYSYFVEPGPCWRRGAYPVTVVDV